LSQERFGLLMCYTNKCFSVDVDQPVTSFKPSVLEGKKDNS